MLHTICTHIISIDGDITCSQVFPSACREMEDNCAVSDTCSRDCARCSRDCSRSVLNDCDLGPSTGLPSTNIRDYFYTLHKRDMSRNFTWLEFTFNNSETFVLESIQMYYYCTDTTELTMEYTDHFNSIKNGLNHPMRLSCGNTECQKVLDFKIDDDQPVMQQGAKIRVKIRFLELSSILYISEVLFFVKVREDVSPTRSGCCSKTVEPEPSENPRTPTQRGSCATVATIRSPVTSAHPTPSPTGSALLLLPAATAATTTTTAPSSTPDLTAGGGGQGAVVAIAATGTLAGLLAIVILALVVACFAVIVYRRRHDRVDSEEKGDAALANPVYNARELGHAAKTDDNFTNPAYSTSALGRVAGVNEEYIIPAYSSVAIGSSGPERLHDSLRPESASPQYAVLESPSALTASTGEQPQHYEEVDDKIHSSHSSQANAITTRLPPTTAAMPAYEFSDDYLKGENREHAHNTADHLPVRPDSPAVGDTYSHLVHDPPGKREPPDPSYFHLVHDSQAGEARGGGAEPASDPSSYSHLLHRPQGGGDQVTEAAATAHGAYSRLELGGGGQVTESAYSHFSDSTSHN